MIIKAAVSGTVVARIYAPPSSRWKRWFNHYTGRFGWPGRWLRRRNGGLFKGDLKHTASGHNMVSNEALNSIASCYLVDGTQIYPFYMGLYQSQIPPPDTPYINPAQPTDTMASHGNWVELTMIYSEATRPSWIPGATLGIATGTSMFNMTTTVEIDGILVSSNDVVGGNSGLLWATAWLPNFGGSITVNNGDVLDVTYSVSL
jgi:hypothetical protein